MNHEPYSLYSHNVLIWFDCISVIIYCISKEASMRAKQFCALKNNRIYGEDLALVKCVYPPPPPPPMDKVAVRSKAVALLLLIYCFMFFTLFAVVLCLSLFCYVLLCVHSSFAIILKRKRKLVLQIYCYYKCSVALPYGAGLRYVIVVFPDHTHLLYKLFHIEQTIDSYYLMQTKPYL